MWYSIQLCRANPDKIFVFGDNLIGKGKAGQAVIRDEPNAFGIPTKRIPSMKPGSFFSDQPDEFRAVTWALNHLDGLAEKGKKIVIPDAGIGTGLAKMEEYSPKLFKYMNDRLAKYR